MIECLVVGPTIGPLPQPCAVQACSLSMCWLQGSSPSTTKNLCVELEFKIWTPSSHRPKLVTIPVRRIHWVMKYEIKKENKNDISNLFTGHSADWSFQRSEQIWCSTQCDYIILLPWNANHLLCTFGTQLKDSKYFKNKITECRDCVIAMSLSSFFIWTLLILLMVTQTQ